jgi:hypothetical protein
MRQKYPQFKPKIKGDNNIEFIGELKVKEELPAYTVSITYRGNNSPLVKILKPELVEKPPHFYHNSKTLCLYHPTNFFWSSEKLICNEILGWTIGWIYFYEVWLQTKTWYGPEVSHKLNKNKND